MPSQVFLPFFVDFCFSIVFFSTWEFVCVLIATVVFCKLHSLGSLHFFVLCSATDILQVQDRNNIQLSG